MYKRAHRAYSRAYASPLRLLRFRDLYGRSEIPGELGTDLGEQKLASYGGNGSISFVVAYGVDNFVCSFAR